MYQKLIIKKIKWQELKLELHIMQVRKFGEISHMIVNVIFGRLDV